MRFRFLSLLAPVLMLSAVLAACGDATPTDAPIPPAATPTARPTVKFTTAAAVAAATVAAPPTPTVKVTQFLPPYGCLPAITIKEVVVQACMDKPSPNQNNTLQLTTRMSADGTPVVGAPVKTTWNFKSGKKECSTTSDKDGVGFCYQNIGAAEVGFRVLVEVQYDYKGAGYRAETSFTPVGAAFSDATAG